jgi:hypothetical protein
MDKSDYRKALQAATAEFDKLIRERLEIDQRIVRLKQTIAGLAALCNGNGPTAESLSSIVPLSPRFMRLTSAIRQVLARASSPMRLPEIRRALLEHGVTTEQYGNKLAVIHNTLSRLQRQGEVTKLAGGWTLTDKGRLSSRIDSLDFGASHSAEEQRNAHGTVTPEESASPTTAKLVRHRRYR